MVYKHCLTMILLIVVRLWRLAGCLELAQEAVCICMHHTAAHWQHTCAIHMAGSLLN